MINQDGFVTKWEKQRARGRIVYAFIHAAVFAGLIGVVGLAFILFGLERPEELKPQTFAFFAIGGFAYGLIRFNIRERFYRSLKGPDDDGS